MKKLLAVLLVLPVAAGISSCNKKNEKEIEFYHTYFQEESEWKQAKVMRDIYADFAKLHKDEYTFKAIPVEDGLNEKVLAEVANGRFFDIVDMGGLNSTVNAAVSANLVMDLKPYIDKDPKLKAGIGLNYEQNLVDGKIYTVREQLETIGFWYNEDLFKKADAKLPDQWKTWTDFSEAVEKIKTYGKLPFSINNWGCSILLNAYLLKDEAGRSFLTKEPTNFDNDAFKGAIQFLQEKVLGEIGAKDYTADGDANTYRDEFYAGNSAMLINGVWESGAFKDKMTINVNDIKAGNFPTDDETKKGGLITVGVGTVVSANLSDLKKKAAIDFITYMNSKEVAERIFKDALAMPASTELNYDSYLTDSDNIIKGFAQACKLIDNSSVKLPMFYTAWGDLAGETENKYAGLHQKTKTVADVVKELNQKIKK